MKKEKGYTVEIFSAHTIQLQYSILLVQTIRMIQFVIICMVTAENAASERWYAARQGMQKIFEWKMICQHLIIDEGIYSSTFIRPIRLVRNLRIRSIFGAGKTFRGIHHIL